MLTAASKIWTLVRFYRLSSLAIAYRHVVFFAARHAHRRDFLRSAVYGASLAVPLRSDGIGRGLYVYRERELDHKWILERVLRPHDVIFDLGSNIGYYAVLQALILENHCEIYCVEPDPRNVPLLERNLSETGISSIVSFEHCAIADYEGEGALAMMGRTNLSKLETRSADLPSLAPPLTPVVVHDFVNYLRRISKPVGVVRMDIEGGEIAVFRSLIRARDRGEDFDLPRTIIFETHDYGTTQTEMRSLLEALIAVGYRATYITSDDEASKTPRLREMGYAPIEIIHEAGVSRGIYTDVPSGDAVRAISQWKGTRTVCLELATRC